MNRLRREREFEIEEEENSKSVIYSQLSLIFFFEKKIRIFKKKKKIQFH